MKSVCQRGKKSRLARLACREAAAGTRFLGPLAEDCTNNKVSRLQCCAAVLFVLLLYKCIQLNYARFSENHAFLIRTDLTNTERE